MKKIVIPIFILLFGIESYSQEKIKLVVGIVVDQMRYDYIYRFWDDFGDNGFKRLVNEGYYFRNANFSYVPTYTGPGHASIFTGTTPSSHGIISNDWYDKSYSNNIYCVGDDSMHTVGGKENDFYGKVSPKRMLTTTIGDEMQLFSDAKVIGISIKDRGAILAAGHSADAAYWMNAEGKWISSTYYMKQLPKWLQEVNKKDNVKKYMSGSWKLKDEFTYNLDTLLRINGRGQIKKTPFGNSILNDLAINILKEEKLGKNKTTDFLAVSFSSTDYIGHQYGPHSSELFDTYVRLDKDIAKLLKVLDSKVGIENIVVFLTSDHGVVSQPSNLIAKNIPAGYFDKTTINNSLKNYLNKKLGDSEWILNYSNNQFFLNRELIEKSEFALGYVQQICADFLINIDGIKNTFTASQMHNNEYQDSFHALIQKGFNQKRSGDIIIALQSGWIDNYWMNGGTTHGSSYSYDTHVPLIFWGGNIKQGKSDRAVYIKDIAPTICTILGISHPSGSTGEPIQEVTE